MPWWASGCKSSMVTGTDFGAQQGPFFSPQTYRTLFKPFHAKINDWIHTHTTWKSFIHSCGSIWRLLDDIVDAGFDCLNPVQTSAAEMDPEALKAKYGDRVTFWGGGIDTQKVLPFGTPKEVRAMVPSEWLSLVQVEVLSSTPSTMCRLAYRPRTCWRFSRRSTPTAAILSDNLICLSRTSPLHNSGLDKRGAPGAGGRQTTISRSPLARAGPAA